MVFSTQNEPKKAFNLHISKKSCNFAAESCKEMINGTNIFALESTLMAFFDCVTKSNQTELADPFLQAMTSIFHGQTTSLIIPFDLDDASTAKVIDQLKEHL